MPRTPVRFYQPNRTFLIISLLLLLFSFACQTPAAADTRAADENALRTVDEQWSKAAGAKDVEKTISYYTDDAIVMPQNSPPLTSKEQNNRPREIPRNLEEAGRRLVEVCRRHV